MKNYLVPDERMSEMNWQLFMAAIKCKIFEDDKYLKFDDIGVELNFMDDEISNLLMKIVVSCFDASESIYKLEGEELENELRLAKEHQSEPQVEYNVYTIGENQYLDEYISDELFSTIFDYAHKYHEKHIDLDEAAYECSKELYLKFLDGIE